MAAAPPPDEPDVEITLVVAEAEQAALERLAQQLGRSPGTVLWERTYPQSRKCLEEVWIADLYREVGGVDDRIRFRAALHASIGKAGLATPRDGEEFARMATTSGHGKWCRRLPLKASTFASVLKTRSCCRTVASRLTTASSSSPPLRYSDVSSDDAQRDRAKSKGSIAQGSDCGPELTLIGARLVSWE